MLRAVNGARPGRWLLLTGDRGSIDALAGVLPGGWRSGASYGLVTLLEIVGAVSKASANHSGSASRFGHSALSILVDRYLTMRGQFSHTDERGVARLREAIEALAR